MVTPFLPSTNRPIDYDSAGRIIEHLIGNGVDFLVVLGSTGEAATIAPEEQTEFVQFCTQRIAGRVPVVLGCSSNDTAALVRRLESMSYEGVDYVLTAAPAYNKPSQRGLKEHFAAAAHASQRPLILYNVPGRTGVNILPETTCALAREHANIVAIKEACGDVNQVAKILRGRPKGFAVLSGDDALTLPMMSLGATGVISVIGNVTPRPFADLVHLTLAGKLAEAASLHMRLMPLFERLFTHGNPAGVKAAMARLGLCENTLRLPLTTVPDEFLPLLDEAIREAQQS